jgi:hypothetical protein
LELFLCHSSLETFKNPCFIVMQWLLFHHLPCSSFAQYDWLNNNNDNIDVWSMTNVLLYSIALVNVLINGHGYLSNFVLVNALINLNDWPMLVLNQSRCFFFNSIIFPLINTIDMIIQCQWQHQSLINGTMYASFIELFLSMFDHCYFVPNEKKITCFHFCWL